MVAAIDRQFEQHDLRLPQDPTPEEIRQRALEIQQTWSRHVRRRRGSQPARVFVQLIRLDDIQANATGGV